MMGLKSIAIQVFVTHFDNRTVIWFIKNSSEKSGTPFIKSIHKTIKSMKTLNETLYIYIDVLSNSIIRRIWFLRMLSSVSWVAIFYHSFNYNFFRIPKTASFHHDFFNPSLLLLQNQFDILIFRRVEVKWPWKKIHPRLFRGPSQLQATNILFE